MITFEYFLFIVCKILPKVDLIYNQEAYGFSEQYKNKVFESKKLQFQLF